MTIPVVPRLVVVVDEAGCALPLVDVATAAEAGGADQIQIREPAKSSQEISDQIERILNRGIASLKLTVNGHPDLAIRYRTNLHLPERMSSLPRPVQLKSGLMSRSIHGPVSPTFGHDADYFVAGNARETVSKEGKSGLGAEGISRVVASSSRPVVIIGGLTPTTVRQFNGTGIAGIAVRSFVIGSADPETATRQLVEVLAGMAKNQEFSQIEIQVNGKKRTVNSGISLLDFLGMLGLHEKLVVVEHNGTILKRGTFQETLLSEGDVIEIAHFVGGG